MIPFYYVEWYRHSLIGRLIVMEEFVCRIRAETATNKKTIELGISPSPPGISCYRFTALVQFIAILVCKFNDLKSFKSRYNNSLDKTP